MMNILFKANYETFKAYAMNNCVITIIYTLFNNNLAVKLNSVPIPNTLGTLSYE